MSLPIDHIISIIDRNRPMSRSCIKFLCGICSKTVKKITKQFNVTLVIFGFIVDVMMSPILNIRQHRISLWRLVWAFCSFWQKGGKTGSTKILVALLKTHAPRISPFILLNCWITFVKDGGSVALTFIQLTFSPLTLIFLINPIPS